MVASLPPRRAVHAALQPAGTHRQAANFQPRFASEIPMPVSQTALVRVPECR
jgi:hypothetical protein